MNCKKMGTTIKTLRLKKELTQHQLADKLGVTDKAVSKWERGLGAPDISMLNRLSILLDIDTDNLLEGNIAYLENVWIGVLRIDRFSSRISATAEVYGKPIVYIYLCYFALAGIKQVFLYCSEKDHEQIENIIGDGSKYGMNICYNVTANLRTSKRMEIDNAFFIYGPNLTKYFQRAMSHQHAVTVLVAPRTGMDKNEVYSNAEGQAPYISAHGQLCRKLPIKFISECGGIEEYEQIGRGMIQLEIKTIYDLLDISNFIHFATKISGESVYCLEQIAYRRGFIDKKQCSVIANSSIY